MKKFVSMLLIFALVAFGGVMSYVTTSQAATSAVIAVNGTYTEIYNVTFGADTDVQHNVLHGLGSAPELISVTPMDLNCASVTNTAATAVDFGGMPYVSLSNATGILIGKASSVGSATCWVQVTIQIVHSIIR